LRHPHHYDPNQPRVPKGYDGGGLWTDGKERELSKLRLKFAGPLTEFLSRLRARPRQSPPMPPPPLTVPPAQMAPRKLPRKDSGPLQPAMPDGPAIPDEPTKPFDLNECKNLCALGNVPELKQYCIQTTREGSEERRLCWGAVRTLERGNTVECENFCNAIGHD
jgi:hypothetical protein